MLDNEMPVGTLVGHSLHPDTGIFM
ncbi:hypothetical protein RDI58_024484 [Solanum bulbocastanum]|uniref:Uncharacterized protein n=1 Tax=Solanum bulbocastanum TaxID=147425 RepID=A0AAN8T3E2_SOLBU